jgi:hypothetical protein
MRWLIGMAALVILTSCNSTMDVPTPRESLDGVYRVQATLRETDCGDIHPDIGVSYLISLSIHDDGCRMCGVEGSWNATTRTAMIESDTGSLSISYQTRASAEEHRPIFRGIRTETRPSSGCSASWTVVLKKIAFD